MSLQNNIITGLIIAVVIALAMRAQADDVADYLESHGLYDLLAVHYEEQLGKANTKEKEQLAIRLAELYAQLLESTNTFDDRVYLEARSEALLKLVPEESADDLRLALLQGKYSAAEKICENHRLRMGNPEDVDRAKTILTEAIPRFNVLKEILSKKLAVAERKYERSNPNSVNHNRLSLEVNRLRSLHSRTIFLSAWAQYYISWLRDRPENARVAEELFAYILDPEIRRFVVKDVSMDLLETEAFSRTVLGMALCKSLTSRLDTAINWVDLLAEDNVFEAIRKQAPAWKLAIILEHEEFSWAGAYLTELKQSEDEIPLVWLRLIAVRSLEKANTNSDAARLAQDTVAELAARGELQQVLDLADRYGIESLGSTGFASLYVRGAQQYQKARNLHGSDVPSNSEALATLYNQAADAFSNAMQQPDVKRFPVAAAGAQSLIGWCFYFQGRFLEARTAFTEAANNLPPKEAPEALWMAIVSFEKVARADSNSEKQEQLDQLIKTFLTRYPSSEYAPRLVLRQSEFANSSPSMEMVEELLSVPVNSESYHLAQRRAAQMLYQLFQNAAGSRRYELGERYLNIAVPLWARTDESQVDSDEIERKAFTIRARRILEVALSPGIERLTAAENTISRLEEAARNTSLSLEEIVDELDFRRIQIAISNRSASEAQIIAERMWPRNPDAIWTVAGIKLVFKTAVQEWREETSSYEIGSILSSVVHYGKWILEGLDKKNASLQDTLTATYYSTVAEAAMLIWDRIGDQEMGSMALDLYKNKLLVARPSNAAFLYAAGILAQAYEDNELALSCWRKLSIGKAAGSDEWFEAKFRQIQILLKTDVAHAQRVFVQLKALYPDLGPEPWNSNFIILEREIKDKLGQQRSDDSSSSDEDNNKGEGQ